MITIPTQEKDISDLDVFNAFNYNIKDLHPVYEALKLGNIVQAKKSLIKYFEYRKNPVYYFDYRDFPIKSIDTNNLPYCFQSALGLKNVNLKKFMLYVAERLTQKVYVLPPLGRDEIFLGKNYENMPHFNCFTDKGKKHRHNVDMFVRGQFFESLAVAYHETKDKKYLDCFIEIFKIFQKNYLLNIEDTRVDANRFMFSEDRDVMSAGWLTLVLSSLLYTRIPYEIPTEVAFEILKKIWFIGIQFRRFDEDYYRPYNHHFFERGLVPYMLSTLFPEISIFADMRKTGIKISRQHILEDFNIYGGYNEHSICYWASAALGEMLTKALLISRKNNNDLLNVETKERVSRTFDVLAKIASPNYRYPGVGDHEGPIVDTILKLGIATMDNNLCKKVLAIRNNEELEKEDLDLDYSNSEVGFTVTRSSYKRNANYLLLSTKINCGYSGHNHMDMLSVFITIRGEEIIGEPYIAKIGEQMTMGSLERGYIYNMDSHNTVLCNSKSIQDNQMYANDWGVYRPDSPVIEFNSSETGCYIKAVHYGYTYCCHQREIWFNRKHGMIFRDKIINGNRIPAPHIQRWHLTEKTTIKIISNNIILIKKNNVKVLFIWNCSNIKIWKNEMLCNNIFKDYNMLYPIIDIYFDSNISEVRTLVLDVTEISEKDIQEINKIDLNHLSLDITSDVYKFIENQKMNVVSCK